MAGFTQSRKGAEIQNSQEETEGTESRNIGSRGDAETRRSIGQALELRNLFSFRVIFCESLLNEIDHGFRLDEKRSEHADRPRAIGRDPFVDDTVDFDGLPFATVGDESASTCS